MNWMTKSTITIAIGLGLIAVDIPSPATQPTYDYSDKPLTTLLAFLKAKDPEQRACAAIYIGVRYPNPNQRASVNGPRRKPNALPPVFPVPVNVIHALDSSLTNDRDAKVRICVVEALKSLREHFNTTAILQKALQDEDFVVRVHACSALDWILKHYGDSSADRVNTTLIECLNCEDPEAAWQAAYAAGQMGRSATVLVPLLRQLATNGSPKLASYAARAADAIVTDLGSRPHSND